MKAFCIVLLLSISQVVAQTAYASCQLVGTTADGGITGTVLFSQTTYGGPVTITATVSGVTVNTGMMHGLHIHNFGDLSDQTSAAVGVGGHWNYNGSLVHGCPEIDGLNRHNGDLGNWNVSDTGAISQTKIINEYINLSGPDSIIGRGLVLHGITDPCTNGTVYGPRIALCVIGVQNTTTLPNVTNMALNSNTYQTAVCWVQPTIYSNVTGAVWFTQTVSGTTVVGHFNGLVGMHGFHVHQFGDLRGGDGLASGSHWNPTASAHGIPPFSPRHVGDMGNIFSYANDSSAWYSYVNNDILTLSGPNSIVGRTVTIHVDADICSPPTGGAGSRIAQCVVGLVNSTFNAPPTVPVEISAVQNISTCQALYPVNGTNATSGATSAMSTQATTMATTQGSNSIALFPLAFVVLAILVFSL